VQNLSPQEFQFVTEILNGSTIEQAGEAVGIKRRSAFLWKKKEHIQAALAAGEEGQTKIIEQFQANRAQATLPAVSNLLQEAAPEMITILIELARTANFSTKLLAAKEVIRLSGIIENQHYTETRSTELVKQKGLSPEEANAIRAQILGISIAE
jgi:hypothetical protein